MAELLTLARPYAKAVFHLADENKQLEQWSEILRLLSLIALHPEVQALQSNPNVSDDDVLSFYQDVGGSGLNDSACNLLRLLAQNGRLALLPSIACLYEQHKTEALKQVEVEVVSAFELTQAQQQLFAERMKDKLGKEVNLHCRQDSSLIGGAIVRAGDKVIDGSVRGKLTKMAEGLGA